MSISGRVPSSRASTGRPLTSLSAFFPVRDEEDNVVPVAEAFLDAVPALAEWTEIIIVDDGSRDRTGERADALARAHRSIRVIHHPVGRGYGAALRSGITAARGEWVFFTDGDRQFDPSQLGELVAHAGRADAVVGYRYARSDPFARRLNGVAWNALVRALLAVPVRDVNCAFKLLRRSALAGIELTTDGAVLSTELMVRLARGGHRIVEVPVRHYPRGAGVSSGGDVRVIARAFGELFRLVLRELRYERPAAWVRLRPHEGGLRCD